MDPARLQFSIVLTGEIRDESIFVGIAAALRNVREQFATIVFSTWIHEIVRHAHLVADMDFMRIATCGEPVPVAYTRNRDVTSFLVQHQQLVAGFELCGPDDIVLRVRADDPHFARIDVGLLLVAVRRFLAGRLGTRCEVARIPTFVRYMATTHPFFFDDRFVVFSPSQRRALEALPLAAMYRTHTYNLFPEFMMFSARCWHDVRFPRELLRINYRPYCSYQRGEQDVVRDYLGRADGIRFWSGYRAVVESDFETLYEAIDEAVTNTDEPAEAGRLRALRDSFSSYGNTSKALVLRHADAMTAIAECNPRRVSNLKTSEIRTEPGTGVPALVLGGYFVEEEIFLALERVLAEQRPGDFEELAARLPPALADHPFVAQCFGVFHIRKNELTEAHTWLRRSFETGGPGFWTMHHLVSVLQRLRHWSELATCATAIPVDMRTHPLIRRQVVHALAEAEDDQALVAFLDSAPIGREDPDIAVVASNARSRLVVAEPERV